MHLCDGVRALCFHFLSKKYSNCENKKITCNDVYIYYWIIDFKQSVLLSFLQTDIEFLKGVGPSRGEALRSELDIRTVGDLLQLYPFRYIDKTQVQSIKSLKSDGDVALVKGELISLEIIKGANNRQRLSGLIQDDTGIMELVWFQQIKALSSILEIGKVYILFGKPASFGSKKSISHPEIEEYLDDLALHQSFDPVYPSTEKLDRIGLDSKGRRKLVKLIVDSLAPSDIGENLPDHIMSELKLPTRYDAMRWIHFPKDDATKILAQNRIKFEEFFFLQVQLMLAKSYRKNVLKGINFPIVGDLFNDFYKNYLPFELTNAQKRVIKEIRHDLGSGFQMNRLLQGDVGSGKTMVALLCMLIAAGNGYQSCLMAPTEILATQHYHSLTSLLNGLDMKVAFLSGSVKGKKRKVLLEELENGVISILIGTHAVIEEKVVFANLGLSITDEQHRFGVAQRAKLWNKTEKLPPHVLVMTATPIPRTLAMSTYGDLDISVIDELPPGRKEIKTIHKFESYRPRIIEFMHQQIAEGRQIYVVYPLIEESEKLDLQDLQQGYESLLQYFPPDKIPISVVHGRMKSADKEWEMNRFVKAVTKIMVATTVIEVGVNVTNASTMIIENSERFGLSQLHQLRGRVGRGADQSYCILMTGNKMSHEAKTRVSTMVRTNNGFEIAEVDLNLRGPGEIEGTRQSGVNNFKLLNLVKDTKIINAARHYAEKIFEEDQDLSQEKHARIKKYVKFIKKDNADWSLIS